MKRTRTALVVVVALLSVTAPALGTSEVASLASSGDTATWQQTETETATTADPSNGTTAESDETTPGARLGGVVAVQGVELGGELESRSLDHQLNRSGSNASKAAVVAQQTRQSSSRLDALRTERRQLEAAHENGTISENEYRVRATRLSARITATRRVVEQTSVAADSLPNETLRQNGVNVTALRSLRTMADELAGPEIAAIAREIAGPGAGSGVGPAADERRGPPEHRGPSESSGQGAPPGERTDSARGTNSSSGERTETAPTRSENATDDGSTSGNGRDTSDGDTGQNGDRRDSVSSAHVALEQSGGR